MDYLSIAQAIVDFRLSQGELIYDPEVVAGCCGDVSLEFVDYLLELEIIDKNNRGSECLLCPGAFGDWEITELVFQPEWQIKWYPPTCHESHMVVRLGNVNIDWTARQFHENAPVPLIMDSWPIRA